MKTVKQYLIFHLLMFFFQNLQQNGNQGNQSVKIAAAKSQYPILILTYFQKLSVKIVAMKSMYQSHNEQENIFKCSICDKKSDSAVSSYCA